MKADAFRGQVVIVTGASARIGRALALQLAGLGAKVAIAARRAERLEEVTLECRQRGGETLVIPTDVSAEAQCKALIEKTIAAYGRLDMLVNNAGLAGSALFDEFPDLCLFKHTMDVNFLWRGVLYVLCSSAFEEDQRAYCCNIQPGWQGSNSVQHAVLFQQICYARIL